MARLFYIQREILYAVKLMSLTLREISLQIKRFSLAFGVYMLSTSMTYFAPQRHYASIKDASAQDHSTKLGKFMLAGEALPFDSPKILHRYHKEIKLHTLPSEVNMHMIKASRRWFPLIEPILAKHGIPNDFKYVAAAESKFVYATSIKGAQGFWQMMPNTARELGLEVNEEVDERYHVTRSTEVACRFFKQNYKMFGDWTSVVLAYNMGPYGLLKLKKQQNQENVHFVKTNRETERYFFLILAARELIEYPAKYGYSIKGTPSVSNVRTHEVTKSISDLRDFCKQQKISFYTLKNYNPWLRANTLTIKDDTKGKKYTLILPNSNELLEEVSVESPIKNISINDSTIVL